MPEKPHAVSDVPSNPSPLERFQILQAKIYEQNRIAGTYVLNAATVPNWFESVDQRETFLHQFAAEFGFSEPDIGQDEWKHAEVLREDARERIIHALIGGAEIGHSQWDVEPTEALKIAEEFLGLFSEDARFFCDAFPVGRAQMLAPYKRPDFHDYIFGGGCVAFDCKLAAVLWVLDND